MLARISLLAINQRRYRRTAFGFTSTLAVLGSASVVRCRCQDHGLYKANEAESLFIPTLEASLRAVRLLRTAFLMAMDYEVAKVTPYIFPTNLGLEDLEHKRLESEVEKMEKVLEDAQMEYAGKNKKEEENLSLEERRKMKAEQKKRMQEAANRLADAEEQLASMEGESEKSKLHRKAAQRLMQLCRENGGLYIKVGQHLANLDYLIPEEYIEVLSSLFDAAPQSNYNDVCRVIEEELNEKIEDLFDNFDPEPIASASLAQVHVAYDKETGRKLAVKIQHAGLRETSRGDIFAVCSVVRIIESIFEDFTFGWIADEIAPHLPKELDFTREGRNAERAAAHIADSGLDCVVPKVLWKKTAARVLTMEFEEGFKATDLDAIQNSGLNKRDVAKLVSSVFNSQVFLSGWVHCDPHPANVLLRNNNGKPQMVLVDHGLYKDIDDDFRIVYAELWRSLMMADLDGIKSACHGMGIDKAYPLFAAMLTARPYDEIIERSKTGSLSARRVPSTNQADKAVIRGYAKRFLKEIFLLLGTLPRQMLLLLKMNDCLRHIDYALGSPTNTLVVAGSYASKAVYKERLKEKNSSMSSRISLWLDYMKVLFRIQLHDFGAWLLHNTSGLKLLKLS